MTKSIEKKSSLRTYLTAALGALALACALGVAPEGASAQRREAAAEAPADGGVVNIQTANETELALLPGVGPARASAIVAYRADHPFRRVEDIMRVRGIGRAMFRRMRSHITVEGPTTLRSAIGMGPRGAAAPSGEGEDDAEAGD